MPATTTNASASRPVRMAEQQPADVDDEQPDRAVEHATASAKATARSPAGRVAPEEVGDDRDRDEEGEPEQRAGGRERRLGVQEHDRRATDGEDQQVADERRHAVMYARTPSAAATSVATANQSSRARGSAGA